MLNSSIQTDSGSSSKLQKFLSTAESHIGEDGKWAWSTSGLSVGQPWCAAFVVACAKTAGVLGTIINNSFGASEMVRGGVRKNYGTYHKGPYWGLNNYKPQPGDLIVFRWDTTSYPSSMYDYYSSDHVGIVKEVIGDVVYTIEGNTVYNGVSSRCGLKERGLYARYINGYFTPNWASVGDSVESVDTSQPVEVIDTTSYQPLYSSYSTNEDATLREVCYIGKDGKPSIKSTGLRLSIINYTGALSALIESYGFTSQDQHISDNLDQLPSVPRSIVEYMRRRGLSTSAAVGIVANIDKESKLKTSAVGDNGTSFGLCQWHNARAESMKLVAGSSWSTNLTGQLDYLWLELTTTYKNNVLDPLRRLPNSEDGAKQAADIFVRNFEIPSGVDIESAARQSIASRYWKLIVPAVSTTTPTVQQIISTQTGGRSVLIPESVPQTGICPNYTFYDLRWHYDQGKLHDIWVSKGKPHKYGIAVLDGYFLIATTTKFGRVGDKLSVILQDGTGFNAILGDSKGDNPGINPHPGEDGSEWGHKLGGKNDIVEFEAYSGSSSYSQNTLRQGLKDAGWSGKKVAKIVNYGSYLR